MVGKSTGIWQGRQGVIVPTGRRPRHGRAPRTEDSGPTETYI